MWYLYIIRVTDNFNHLSMITNDLQEILYFIENLTKVAPKDFYYEIVRKEELE